MDLIWWVTAVAGAIVINLIASELFAWGPRFSECLMRRAVRRLAPEMQPRMEEEWAGHLQTIPPGLWRIVEAAGFCLATRQINVALRVRERQEKPEEKTLQEKVRWNDKTLGEKVRWNAKKQRAAAEAKQAAQRAAKDSAGSHGQTASASIGLDLANVVTVPQPVPTAPGP